ncbi:MAG: hypothetical protein CVV64_11130 [Candidatus Wallbacteria bacterium HGW-Wallbacteria-1]|jgi:hypothetical protein|uniref:EndoU domain-containing protein n=1 Tax=Candidatus Wallbacteria bacterium HGW-Wallbacteria-1 TaxID=2013854 RepID=A0A2N1PP05_9BACT|nr:MAG: hypothetical protein CVV64_11130 [Candidatus Wallbacteria bacterium HGW-Wallbacteria-1]
MPLSYSSILRSRLFSLAAIIALTFGTVAVPTFAQSTYPDSEAMTSIVQELCPASDDYELDTINPSSELMNAISTGRIRSGQQFGEALSTVLTARVRSDVSAQDDRGGFSAEITSYTKSLASLDKDRIKVTMNENSKGMLFNDISGSIPASYKRTMDLCMLFNPTSKTNDHKRLNSEIDAYLSAISSTEPIKYALKVTQTTIEDLKANWFGAGLGFEHVIAGELKGSSVSGYHFWYRFYRDERMKAAKYLKTLEGGNDSNIFTGSFDWDPDGAGNQYRSARKKKGGFVVGPSAEVLIALGHIAIEVAKKNNCPSSFTFQAAVNDSVYTWQMFTMGRSIRSLYPMVSREYNRSEKMVEAQEELVDHIMGSEMVTETIH